MKKILLSAYACEPGRGSEPGVGWNFAVEIAKHHEVWVFTRANNRNVIKAEMARNPIPNLHFAYHDLPAWARWWKHGGRGVQLYYYLWQLSAYFPAGTLHKQVGFDIGHHVTFGRYWSPSFLALLPLPFIWGPVGGGEFIQKNFLKEFPIKEGLAENLRSIAQQAALLDPLVRKTIKKAQLCLATTTETANKLTKIGVSRVQVFPQVVLGPETIQHTEKIISDEQSKQETILIFLSIGRPLFWKGFHLGLKSFAEANIPDAKYIILTPKKGSSWIEKLVCELKIQEKVEFIHHLQTMSDVYRLIHNSDILVHPALHEAFGNVVLEAMLLKKPVICLDCGGPGMLITQETGIKVSPITPEQTIQEIKTAMMNLAHNTATRREMGQKARQRAVTIFSWAQKYQELSKIYEKAINSKL